MLKLCAARLVALRFEQALDERRVSLSQYCQMRMTTQESSKRLLRGYLLLLLRRTSINTGKNDFSCNFSNNQISKTGGR